MTENPRALTVTQLNEYVKMLIDGNPVLGNVFVKGEISNLKLHTSGHIYFSVKDDKSRVNAVMFRADAVKLSIRPENGMKVIIHGRVSVFPRDGAYQIYATSIEPDGIGALYIAYEQLKKKLDAEGLFSELHKKTLPRIPSAVGIITSPTGAAVRDIINVCTRRFPYAKLIIFPALVQGDGAEKTLVEGIKCFNRMKNADVIIIGRGGGSIEDLWAFNSEALAREIFASEIPVISAVGHETDFTICDFVSDKRAPTPSAAAELAVPDTIELKRKLGNVTARTEAILFREIKHTRNRLKLLSESRVLSDPRSYTDDRRAVLLSFESLMERSLTDIMTKNKGELVRLSSVLEALSPLKIISKGYSAVFGTEGKLIKSINDVTVGENISFKTNDGTVGATVDSVTPDTKRK